MLAGELESLAGAARSLLGWYEEAARDLPWRRRRDPYAIWISEIMLQQTQVETVLRYYDAFLARFPDLAALAAADEDAVLAAWSGLGYYRRARALHAAAGQIAAAGEWPASAAAWQELPGIGEYTAAAISSIALGEAVPVLDGNVERVLSRLLASAEDPKRAATRRPLRETAAALLVPGRAGDSNQALMELGATVCRPLAPRCGECPLAPCCAGRAAGDPERYPPPRRRRAQEAVERRVFVVGEGGRILLFRRSAAAARLSGLWELPWVESAGGAKQLAAKYGGAWSVEESCGRLRHAITHRLFTIEVCAACWRPDCTAEASGACWYTAEEIEDLATSSLVGKALARWRGAAAADRETGC